MSILIQNIYGNMYYSSLSKLSLLSYQTDILNFRAANLYWKKHFFEYFNVDVSADMNDLSMVLLQGGRGNKNNHLKGVYYRQFFPAKPVGFVI